MKILYLYAEVMGYTLATIKALIALDCEVHLVHWDHKKLTPYKIPDLPGLYKYDRSKQTVESLKAIVARISPDLVVVSGWQDFAYLRVSKYLRKKNGVVVICMDQQWDGTPKQRIANVLGKIGFFKSIFSHAWVAGVSQYEYSRRLGFLKREIVFDLYSAEISLFDSFYQKRLSLRSDNYPHRFLYIGRFELIKGLDTLLAAWELLSVDRKDWQLHMVGNGSLSEQICNYPGVTVKGFMQPDDLMQEVIDAGCFVMPSRQEPWGVVAHEMAAAGLPLILSDTVGSATSFLVSDLNGYTFNQSNVVHLAQTLEKVINKSDEQLISMGKSSHSLSRRLTPLTSAKNLLSLLK